MEHLEHFGLSRDPFRNDPQRRFYFQSRLHRDSERRLLRSVRQGKGLAVLTGPVGSGKTTLVRHLLDELDESHFEASLLVLIQGAVEPDWLLDRVARQIGVEEPASKHAEVLSQIYARLVAIREQGRRAVLLVDEAQMLDRKEILVELRGLLNLEYDEERLLSMVLAGLPELGLALHLDPPLADRVEIRVELSHLDAESAGEYLRYRIQKAGGNPAILEPHAAAEIVRLAAGVPRRMNTLADNALYEAYLAERPAATSADVRRAAEDLGWPVDENPPGPDPSVEAEPGVWEEQGRRWPGVSEDAADEPRTPVEETTGDPPPQLREIVEDPLSLASESGCERAIPFGDTAPDLEPEEFDWASPLADAAGSVERSGAGDGLDSGEQEGDLDAHEPREILAAPIGWEGEGEAEVDPGSSPSKARETPGWDGEERILEEDDEQEGERLSAEAAARVSESALGLSSEEGAEWGPEEPTAPPEGGASDPAPLDPATIEPKPDPDRAESDPDDDLDRLFVELMKGS